MKYHTQTPSRQASPSRSLPRWPRPRLTAEQYNQVEDRVATALAEKAFDEIAAALAKFPGLLAQDPEMLEVVQELSCAVAVKSAKRAMRHVAGPKTPRMVRPRTPRLARARQSHRPRRLARAQARSSSSDTADA